MNGGHDPDALDRIEAALARIERAAASLGGDHRELKARHDGLRGAVAGALSELDALIAARVEAPK